MAHGSVGTSHRALSPHVIAVDTCSGFNVINRTALPPNWQDHVYHTNEPLPKLANADRSPLQLTGVVSLSVRLANTIYRLPFVIAESLAVDILVGTPFINTHVRSIDVETRKILFRTGDTTAILSHPQAASAPPHDRTKQGRDRSEKNVHPIVLARPITVPPMSQTFVRVTSHATGLVTINPKPSVLFRHGVRASNGLHDLTPHKPFEILLANFSRLPRTLPKGTVVAYAERTASPIFTPDREVGEEFGRVLNITTLPNRTNPSDSAPSPSPERTSPPHAPTSPPSKWEEDLDLDHLSDPSLRADIIAMLRKHAAMWNGKLGTIQATEHRINLEPGTRPIRSMPYRQGPAKREIVRTHIEDMLRAGVIEPATSEWASPVVLVPKKDKTLRFCVDYRRLNTRTVNDAYPLPRMDDCIDSLDDATIFSTLDCNSGYWQIPVAQ